MDMNDDTNSQDKVTTDINGDGQLSEVEIISADVLDGGTLRMIISINGHHFKRLANARYPVVWNDEHHTFNDCLDMTRDQESDLEGIFQAWAFTMGITGRTCLTTKK